MSVSRDDLERKAQQIVDAVDDTRTSVQNTAIIGALVVAGVVAAAFIIGRRRGNRSKTVVEVYRV